MSFLETFKSNGFATFIIILFLVDLFSLFLVKGWESWSFILIFQLIGAAVYIVSRSITNVDSKFFLFKK